MPARGADSFTSGQHAAEGAGPPQTTGASASNGPDAQSDLPGTIGHYEVLREIGRGGMGIVYLGRDLLLEREVALKRPTDACTQDPDLLRRFLREAKAASSLSHPHIVTIYETFEQDGVPWIAMALVEGRRLRDLLATQPVFRMDAVLRLAEAIAGALAAAHQRNILHRDVNPNNIMVDERGEALLADFGLARHFLAPDASSTATTLSVELTGEGATVGTPGYTSPEQMRGEPVDERSDIYSLGVVLHEVCTGRRPFLGVEPGDIRTPILQRHAAASAPVHQESADELERIVHKMLAQRPDERYQAAGELLADLGALRRRVEADEYERLHPKRRTVRRWAAVALAVVGAAGLVVGAYALVPWLMMRDRRPLPVGIPHQVTSDIACDSWPALSPDGNLIAYVSEKAGNPDIWLIGVQGGNAIRLTEHPGIDRSPAWLPDGSHIVFVSDRAGRPGVWKVPRLGGAAMPVLEDADEPAVSPDGETIAFLRSGSDGFRRVAVASLRDPADARFITDTTSGLWDLSHPSWSPDGRDIAYADMRHIWSVPISGGNAIRLTSSDDGDFEPVWSSNGRYIYFSSYRGGTSALWRIAAGGGEPERLTMGTGPERQPSVSRNGARLASSTLRDFLDLVVVNLVSGAEERIQSVRNDLSPALAPDGSGLAFVSDRETGRYSLWYQPMAEGSLRGEARRLTDHPGTVSHPVVSPDGRWVAYYRVLHDKRDIWIVPATGGEPRRLTDDPGQEFHPDWSPDGGRIAFVSERDGKNLIYEIHVVNGVRTGAARPVLTTIGTHSEPTYSPDGRELAFIGIEAGEADIWIASLDGGRPPRRLTRGARAESLRWDRASGLLFVAGRWDVAGGGIRALSPRDGRFVAHRAAIDVPSEEGPIDFDVNQASGVLVYSLAERRGDVWILEAEPGTY